MKRSFILYTSCGFVVLGNFCFGSVCLAQSQPDDYSTLVQSAESLYSSNSYLESARTYSRAFQLLGWKGYPEDRYHAACAWAKAGIADSAFFNLDRLAAKQKFDDTGRLESDVALGSLHNDVRWQYLISAVKNNKIKATVNLNIPLAKQLDSILDEDQKYRHLSHELEEKYGSNSKEVNTNFQKMAEADSLNLIFVKSVLDKYGWLGSEVVSVNGNRALFLVIQHAGLATQEEYLPMMKDAVSKGNAYPSDLALLVDRVEMRNKRPQIYGSQITMVDGRYVIYKILDEPNVNKRRMEAGLEPLENYARNWGIEYKIPEK